MPKIAVVVAVLAFAACAADSKPAPGTSGNAVPSGVFVQLVERGAELVGRPNRTQRVCGRARTGHVRVRHRGRGVDAGRVPS